MLRSNKSIYFLIFLFVFLIYILGGTYNHNKIESIDMDFEGIQDSLNNDKIVHLLIIHGIGKHCIGYSQKMVNGIVSNLKLSSESQKSNPAMKGDNSNGIDKVYNNYLSERSKERYEKFTEKVKAWEETNGATLKEKEYYKLFTNKEKDDFKVDRPLLDGDCKIVRPVTFTDEPLQYIKNLFFFEKEIKLRSVIDAYDFESANTETCYEIGREEYNGNDCFLIELKYKKVGFRPETINNTGFIRTQEFKDKDNKPVLRIYELTWDIVSRRLKERYLLNHDSPLETESGLFSWLFNKLNNKREWFNSNLKNDIVNNSFSDAILYLGEYKTIMQYPVLQALCMMAIDGLVNKDKKNWECPFEEISKGTSKRNNIDLKIITHSLGTKIILDSLGLLGDDEFFELYTDKLCENNVDLKSCKEDSYANIHSHNDKIEEKKKLISIKKGANEVRDIFSRSLSTIYTLANQVPLLNLSKIKEPNEKTYQDFGEGFSGFLTKRIDKSSNKEEPNVLKLVAFTDINDLLSYDLKCWHYMTNIKGDQKTKDVFEEYRITKHAFSEYSKTEQAKEDYIQKRAKKAYEELCKNKTKFIKYKADRKEDFDNFKKIYQASIDNNKKTEAITNFKKIKSKFDELLNDEIERSYTSHIKDIKTDKAKKIYIENLNGNKSNEEQKNKDKDAFKKYVNVLFNDNEFNRLIKDQEAFYLHPKKEAALNEFVKSKNALYDSIKYLFINEAYDEYINNKYRTDEFNEYISNKHTFKVYSDAQKKGIINKYIATQKAFDEYVEKYFIVDKTKKLRDEWGEVVNNFNKYIISDDAFEEYQKNEFFDSSTFYDNLFSNCKLMNNVLAHSTSNNKSNDADPWGKIFKVIWDENQEELKIADVFVDFEGFELAQLFKHPTPAHSQYFNSKNLFQLIACGAKMGNKPNACNRK